MKVLEYAREMGVLAKRGGVSVDGTKIGANASKHAAVSYQRAGEQIELLEREVTALLQKAEDADSTPLQDGLTIPDEIARRGARLEKLQAARAVIAARARERAAAERPGYQAKQAQREAKKQQGEQVGGRPPPPPPSSVRAWILLRLVRGRYPTAPVRATGIGRQGRQGRRERR